MPPPVAAKPLAAGPAGCQCVGMGFFDDANPEPDWARDADEWKRPAIELPRAAESALLLARTDMVAVAVTAIWAFSSGFEFWIGVLFRQPGPALQKEPDDQSLHIGLRFADGRKVANVGRLPAPAGSVAGNLILSPLSFGGGMLHRSRTYWARPLPPPGPMTFICEWSAFGIPETATDVDTEPILRAAAQTIKLWPEDKDGGPA
jgi:hypothetical protein